jgi:hypothetical protein
MVNKRPEMKNFLEFDNANPEAAVKILDAIDRLLEQE